jgi:predicted transcriptional regulator
MLPPCTVDEVNIKLRINELLDVEEDLRKAKKENQKIRDDAETKTASLIEEISNLKIEMKNQQEENERRYQKLLTRLTVAEEKAKSQQAQNFIITTFERYFGKKIQEPEAKTRAGRMFQKIKDLFKL